MTKPPAQPEPPPNAPKSYAHELARKSIHLSSALAPVLYALLGRKTALWIAVPLLVLFVLGDLLRQWQPTVRAFYDRRLGGMMRADESRRFCGATYVVAAIVICIAVFEQRVAIAVLLFMSVSDALASLVGLRAGGPRWFNKTIAGSTAFFVSAVIIGVICLPQRPLAAVVGAAVATVVEAVPLKIGTLRLDDNLLVPLVSGGVMTAILAL